VDSSRDFTFVEDSARAIILSSLSKDATGEVINVGSGEDVTIIRLAELIANVVGSEFSIETDPSRFRPYDVDRLICDNSKAKRVLRWEPKIGLQEGLTRTVNWIRKHPIAFKAPFRGDAAWYRTPRLPAYRRSER
jgi:dTDP-glucose 4,6-dehydratase